jgi:histidine phosphotransfer protein HptB
MGKPANGTDVLYSSLGGDLDLGEIVAMFVDEMPERVATLLATLDAGDLEGLRRAAHQLKGAAGSYGFGPISPSAAKVEDAIRANAPEQQIRDSVDALVDLCNRTRAGTPQ